MVLNDLGSVGAGESKTSSVTVPVIVRPTNHAPVIVTPAALNTAEDQLLTLAGIEVSDVDARDTVTVNVSVASGGLVQLPANQVLLFKQSLHSFLQHRHLLDTDGTLFFYP